jgi:hypothetical protein
MASLPAVVLLPGPFRPDVPAWTAAGDFPSGIGALVNGAGKPSPPWRASIALSREQHHACGIPDQDAPLSPWLKITSATLMTVTDIRLTSIFRYGMRAFSGTVYIARPHRFAEGGF